METAIGWNFVTNIATEMPLLLVCAAGIMLAAMRKQRMPRVASLAIVALAIRIVEVFIGTAFVAYVPSLYANADNYSSVTLLVTAMAFVRVLLEATSVGLLLAAAFTAGSATSASSAPVPIGAPPSLPLHPPST